MRDPDLKGVASAWLIKESEEAIQAHIKEWGYPPATLRNWYVNGPYHPFWSWWMVAVISLADIEGLPPANKQFPEAEYEFAIYSIKGIPDIDALDRGDVENRGFEAILSPPDVVFHFHKVTDDQAKKICDAAIKHIVAGQSCDSDYRSHWMEVMSKTVEHYVLGVHE